MDMLHGDVVDRLDAIGLDRFHRGREALAVQLAPVGAQQLLETRLLGAVLEANLFGVAAQVVAADDQLMH
jgi:hypothetical protein